MGSREHPQLPAVIFLVCGQPVGSKARSLGHPTSIPHPNGMCLWIGCETRQWVAGCRTGDRLLALDLAPALQHEGGLRC